MRKKVNIIGAGIAGLSAGCYLQMNGFDSEIFESHSQPGGLCTSWKKGDYMIDGCLHWLVGSNPADPIYGLWNEVIDMKSIRFHDHEEFFRVRDEKGKEIVGYSDIERLAQELLAKAPEDEQLIRDFIRGIRDMAKMPMRNDKAPELFTVFDKISELFSFLPYLGTLKRFSRMTIHELAGQCKNPLLAKFFEFSFASEMPALFIMITFSWLTRKSAGYPIGGSLNFAKMFEKRYLEMGGKIHYNSKVTRIMTENCSKGQGEKGKEELSKGNCRRSKGKEKLSIVNWQLSIDNFHRAKGIELENGQVFESDITISAADGYSTIFNMLEGRFADKRVRHYYENFAVFPSFLQVSLGINGDFSGQPSRVVVPLDQPFEIDPERTIENMYYRIYNYDPTLAPQNKTLITCLVKTHNYKYWQDLRNHDRQKYQEEKNRILDIFINQLDKTLGGIRDKVEMTDVSTPATVTRYTHNWKGSVEGWLITKETGFNSLPKELPGLQDFYMAGQWVEPGGGVPSAFFSGRNLVQVICRKDGRHSA